MLFMSNIVLITNIVAAVHDADINLRIASLVPFFSVFICRAFDCNHSVVFWNFTVFWRFELYIFSPIFPAPSLFFSIDLPAGADVWTFDVDYFFVWQIFSINSSFGIILNRAIIAMFFVKEISNRVVRVPEIVWKIGWLIHVMSYILSIVSDAISRATVISVNRSIAKIYRYILKN